MFSHLLIRTVCAVCLATMTSLAASFYVAPTPVGSDNAAGTQSAPFATITKARDAVKALGTLTADANIYLRGGWHVVTSPITLDQTNSGSGGFNVVYQAVPGEYPVISGGVRIQEWKLSNATKNIWKAKANGINTRQLYVNCIRAQRATGKTTGNTGALTKTSTGYSVRNSPMINWRNPSTIEFVYTGTEGSQGEAWTESRVTVQSISSSAIIMQDPGFTRVCQGFQPHTTPTAIENAYELLDVPGEWYLDRTKDSIFYIPVAGVTMATATIIAPVIEKIINASGALGSPIHNIQFKGITFAHATYLDPSGSNGLHSQQANYSEKGGGPRMPGNVSFQYSQQIKFERCMFKHLGAVGLDLYNGAVGDTAIGCVFTDISGSCIQIGNINDPTRSDTRLRETDNAVLNCYIHDSPTEYHAGTGILAGYVSNLHISHSQISYTPYSAISIGWGWGTASYQGKNEVSYVKFDHWVQLLIDGGAIYSLSSAPGSTWHHNYAHDMGMGIGNSERRTWYTDEGSAYIDIGYNVSQKIGSESPWYSAWTETINNITIHNNYYDEGTFDNNGTNSTSANNIQVSNGNWPQEALNIMAGAGLQSSYTDVLTMQCACSKSPSTDTKKPVFGLSQFESAHSVKQGMQRMHVYKCNGQLVETVEVQAGVPLNMVINRLPNTTTSRSVYLVATVDRNTRKASRFERAVFFK